MVCALIELIKLRKHADGILSWRADDPFRIGPGEAAPSCL
jgi:hypothetical protein